MVSQNVKMNLPILSSHTGDSVMIYQSLIRLLCSKTASSFLQVYVTKFVTFFIQHIKVLHTCQNHILAWNENTSLRREKNAQHAGNYLQVNHSSPLLIQQYHLPLSRISPQITVVLLVDTTTTLPLIDSAIGQR